MKKLAQTSACNSSGLNEFDEWEGKTVLDDNQTSACCSSGRYDGNGCKRGGSGERIAQTSDKRSPGLDEMAKKDKKKSDIPKKCQKTVHTASKSLSIADKPLVACLDSDNIWTTQGELLELTLRR